MIHRAVDQLRPLRRTHSLPGSYHRPARRVEIPPALSLVLMGREQPPALDQRVALRYRSFNNSVNVDEEEEETIELSNRRDESVKAEKYNESIDNGAICPKQLSPEQVSATTERGGKGDAEKETETAESKEAESQPPEVVPFNLERAKENVLWALQWRDTADCLPCGMKSFIEESQQMLQENSQKDIAVPRRQSSHKQGGRQFPSNFTFSASKGSRDASEPRRSGFSSLENTRTNSAGRESSSGPGNTNGAGRDALLAMQRWGETHAASSIPVTLTQRQRGLFGAAKEKTLHQMVIASLNKVTTDHDKFIEVKNELLNLPIPEASNDELQKVMQVFLRKALLEPHFSDLYARLMKHLCHGAVMPSAAPSRSSSPVGTTTSSSSSPSPMPLTSLEARVGRGIIDLCLKKFQSLVECTGDIHQSRGPSPKMGPSPSPPGMLDGDSLTLGDSPSPPPSRQRSPIQAATCSLSEEEMKEKRDQLCGTVQFAFELYKISFIGDQDLTDIILTCCTGSVDGKIETPPIYAPSEAQMSALIKLLGFKSDYFKCATWQEELRPDMLPWLEYWVKEYPVSRIRYLLMSAIEAVKPPRRPSTPEAIAMLPPPFREAQKTALANRQNAQNAQSASSSQKYSIGSASKVPATIGSTASSKNTNIATASTTTSASLASSQAAPTPPPQALAPPAVASAPVSTAQVTEDNKPHIAHLAKLSIPPLMTMCSRETVALDEVVKDLLSTYPKNVHPLVKEWVQRGMQVMKEKWARYHVESLLSLILQWAPTYQVEISPQDLSVTVESAMLESFNNEHYEVPGYFSYFASIVLSDKLHTVMNPDWLTRGVEWVMKMPVDTPPPPLGIYLKDVCKEYEQHTSELTDVTTIIPSTLSETGPDVLGYSTPRFRPLVSFIHADRSSHQKFPFGLWTALLSHQDRQDVIAHSVELFVFDKLREATADVEPVIRDIVNRLLQSPQLMNDINLAAEVLTGVLFAEYLCKGRDFLQYAFPALQIAVDHQNRRESEYQLVREIRVVAELCEPPRGPLQLRVVHALHTNQVISDETFLLWQEYSQRQLQMPVHPPSVLVPALPSLPPTTYPQPHHGGFGYPGPSPPPSPGGSSHGARSGRSSFISLHRSPPPQGAMPNASTNAGPHPSSMNSGYPPQQQPLFPPSNMMGGNNHMMNPSRMGPSPNPSMGYSSQVNGNNMHMNSNNTNHNFQMNHSHTPHNNNNNNSSNNNYNNNGNNNMSSRFPSSYQRGINNGSNAGGAPFSMSPQQQQQQQQQQHTMSFTTPPPQSFPVNSNNGHSNNGPPFNSPPLSFTSGPSGMSPYPSQSNRAPHNSMNAMGGSPPFIQGNMPANASLSGRSSLGNTPGSLYPPQQTNNTPSNVYVPPSHQHHSNQSQFSSSYAGSNNNNNNNYHSSSNNSNNNNMVYSNRSSPGPQRTAGAGRGNIPYSQHQHQHQHHQFMQNAQNGFYGQSSNPNMNVGSGSGFYNNGNIQSSNPRSGSGVP